MPLKLFRRKEPFMKMKCTGPICNSWSISFCRLPVLAVGNIRAKPFVGRWRIHHPNLQPTAGHQCFRWFQLNCRIFFFAALTFRQACWGEVTKCFRKKYTHGHIATVCADPLNSIRSQSEDPINAAPPSQPAWTGQGPVNAAIIYDYQPDGPHTVMFLAEKRRLCNSPLLLMAWEVGSLTNNTSWPSWTSSCVSSVKPTECTQNGCILIKRHLRRWNLWTSYWLHHAFQQAFCGKPLRCWVFFTWPRVDSICSICLIKSRRFYLPVGVGYVPTSLQFSTVQKDFCGTSWNNAAIVITFYAIWPEFV